MIILEAQYKQMIQVVNRSIEQNKSVTIDDSIEIDCDFDALVSLYSQIFVKTLKRGLKTMTTGKLKSIKSRIAKGESLSAISKEFQIGSFKFAKLYVESGLEKKFNLSNILIDDQSLGDTELRKEVLNMIEQDPLSSIDVELVKECIGSEYEELLINLLNEKHFCFETEAQLRSKGKPKTPDVLLSIPMAVYNGGKSEKDTNKTESDSYVVINWIDSKAMFADKDTLTDHLQQLRAYNNRYGRGMVIYWHGYLESIESLLNDDMIIVKDSFPDEWIFPTGETADGRNPAFDLIKL